MISLSALARRFAPALAAVAMVAGFTVLSQLGSDQAAVVEAGSNEVHTTTTRTTVPRTTAIRTTTVRGSTTTAVVTAPTSTVRTTVATTTSGTVTAATATSTAFTTTTTTAPTRVSTSVTTSLAIATVETTTTVSTTITSATTTITSGTTTIQTTTTATAPTVTATTTNTISTTVTTGTVVQTTTTTITTTTTDGPFVLGFGLQCRGTSQNDGRDICSATAINSPPPASSPVVEVPISNVGYNEATHQLFFDVAVINRLSEPIGTADGVTPDPRGIRIFFHTGPTVTEGTGVVVVASDGLDTFTAPAQPYFQYNAVLASGQSTAARTWVLTVPSTVTRFTFQLGVAAETP